MTQRFDPPELQRAIDLLREIYWREFGRGWRAAIEGITKGLAQQDAPRIVNAERPKEG